METRWYVISDRWGNELGKYLCSEVYINMLIAMMTQAIDDSCLPLSHD